MTPSSPSSFSASLRSTGRLPLALVTAFVISCAGSAAASAAGPGVIVKVHHASGVVSPYYRLSARPGARLTAGSLELVNTTRRVIRVRLDAVDGLTTDTLGSAYALRGTGMHGATRWLRLSAAGVSIPPRGHRAVTIRIAVPRSAPPGDHLTGVAVEALDQAQASPSKASKGLMIGEIDRYAIGVELMVPGARHLAVALTGAKAVREPSGLAFLIAARNGGNVILKNVHGWVRVTTGKRLVARTAIQPGTFVSGTAISYPLPVPREQPSEGSRYRVRAALYYAGRVARLDTVVVFGHAAAVAQQSYGGRKLPQPAPRWLWALIPAAAVALAGAGAFGFRRRGVLGRTAGIDVLQRALTGRVGQLPLSVVLLTPPDTGAAPRRRLAHAIRPRLRRADRTCDLGPDGLLVISPATNERAAELLRSDLTEHLLARDGELAGATVRVGHASATEPISADELVARAKASQDRALPEPEVTPAGAARL